MKKPWAGRLVFWPLRRAHVGGMLHGAAGMVLAYCARWSYRDARSPRGGGGLVFALFMGGCCVILCGCVAWHQLLRINELPAARQRQSCCCAARAFRTWYGRAGYSHRMARGEIGTGRGADFSLSSLRFGETNDLYGDGADHGVLLHQDREIRPGGFAAICP